MSRRRPAEGRKPAARERLAAEAARRIAGALRALDPELDVDACLDGIGERLPPALATYPELLSVIVRNHTLERLSLLDEALFSLSCSDHRPLEIVLCSQAVDAGAHATLESLLERHVAVGGPGLTVRLVHAPERRDARGRLANLGVTAASGRYLAFLDDDDVVYPEHHARLVAALRGGEASWAVGRARRVSTGTTADGVPFVRSKVPWQSPARFDHPRLATDNYVPVHAYVLDRERLHGLRIAFPEHLTRQEDYVFLLRLACLFRPTVVHGPPTCEYRFRDDGSNATPDADAPLAMRLARARAWSGANAPLANEKDAIQALLSMEELAELLLDTAPPGDSAAPLRHRLADLVNDALKRLPSMHAILKATMGSGPKR